MWFEPKSGQTRHNAEQEILKCRRKATSGEICRKAW